MQSHVAKNLPSLHITFLEDHSPVLDISIVCLDPNKHGDVCVYITGLPVNEYLSLDPWKGFQIPFQDLVHTVRVRLHL